MNWPQNYKMFLTHVFKINLKQCVPASYRSSEASLDLARILTRFANEEWNSIPKAVFEFYPTNHPNLTDREQQSVEGAA